MSDPTAAVGAQKEELRRALYLGPQVRSAQDLTAQQSRLRTRDCVRTQAPQCAMGVRALLGVANICTPRHLQLGGGPRSSTAAADQRAVLVTCSRALCWWGHGLTCTAPLNPRVNCVCAPTQNPVDKARPGPAAASPHAPTGGVSRPASAVPGGAVPAKRPLTAVPAIKRAKQQAAAGASWQECPGRNSTDHTLRALTLLVPAPRAAA